MGTKKVGQRCVFPGCVGLIWAVLAPFGPVLGLVGGSAGRSGGGVPEPKTE